MPDFHDPDVWGSNDPEDLYTEEMQYLDWVDEQIRREDSDDSRPS